MKKIILILIFLTTTINLLSRDNPNSEKTEPVPIEPKPDEDIRKIIPENYKSTMKGNIHPEFVRSMFITPEQLAAVRKSNLYWTDTMKLGFHIKSRYESRQNFDFNRNTADYSSYTGQTSQVWFLLDPSPYFAIKVAIQDSRLWGGSQVPAGGDARFALTTSPGAIHTSFPVVTKNNTDIREAFILIKKTEYLPFDIQIGRQVYAYGDLKLVGPLNWLLNGFSFDGVRFMYDSKYFRSHLFGTVLSEQHSAPGGTITAGGRANGSIDDAYFTGFYNTIKPFDLFHIDLYALGMHKKWIMNNNPHSTQDRLRQRDDRITTGFRITNRTENNNLPRGQNWDWTLESAWQSGFNGERVNASWDILDQRIGGRPIHMDKVQYDARFLSAETGYSILTNLRLGVGYTYASGDPNRSDSRVGTWHTLFPQIAGSFPNWNTKLGQSTLNAYQNVKSYSIRANYETKYGTFILAVYDTLKAQTQDAWYNPTGAIVTNGSTENFSNERFTKSDRLGKRLFYQYDLTWIYNYAEFISFWSGATLIHGGDAIRNIRDNPNATDINQRYTFDPRSVYFYFMASVAL